MTLAEGEPVSTWQQRVVERSLNDATQRSINRSGELIFAAATLLEQTSSDNFTVQEVADLAQQSVRAVYVHFDGKDDLLLAVFEEAMNAYTRLLSEAIDHYDDPLERVAAAVYFASRLSERAATGISVGIAMLRARFAITMPEQLARAQAPLTELFSRVLRNAAEAGVIHQPKAPAATFILRNLVDSVGANRMLGNQYGLELPDFMDLVEFALHGLHAELHAGWEERYEQHWDKMPRTFSVAQDLKVASREGNGLPAATRSKG